MRIRLTVILPALPPSLSLEYLREMLVEHRMMSSRGDQRLARFETWLGWRACKTSLGLRPVYHHREDRIRAHVQLCWLALLLIRVAETRSGDTWRNLRHELDRMHLVTFATADGRVAQRSALTGDQKTILAALDLPEPPKYLDFTPGADAAVAD